MNSRDSIFDLIHRDHVNFWSLIFDVERTQDPEELLVQLTDEIRNHGAAVDAVIYPRLRKIMKRENVGEFAHQEQAELNDCAERLCSRPLTDEEWNRGFIELKRRLHQHVNRLERRLFKKMKRLLGKKELDALSAEYVGVRNGLVKQAA